jgi:hypothetical protein
MLPASWNRQTNFATWMPLPRECNIVGDQYPAGCDLHDDPLRCRYGR